MKINESRYPISGMLVKFEEEPFVCLWLKTVIFRLLLSKVDIYWLFSIISIEDSAKLSIKFSLTSNNC